MQSLAAFPLSMAISLMAHVHMPLHEIKKVFKRQVIPFNTSHVKRRFNVEFPGLRISSERPDLLNCAVNESVF